MTSSFHPVYSPFTQSQIGQVQTSTAQDIESALQTAYALHRDRDQWLSKTKRIEILKRAAQIIGERRHEIAVQAASEGESHSRIRS